MQPLRNRVKEIKKLKASELAPNSKNFRMHNDYQRQQLRSVFGEVGFAGVSLAYYSERNGGKLTLLDGHLRQEEVGPDFEYDVAILDVVDSEADKIILSFDWLGSLATIDEEKIRALTAEIQMATDEAKKTVEAIAAKFAESEAPEDFGSVDETIETDHKCPKCGYVWSGQSK